jgi:hypothetical protein
MRDYRDRSVKGQAGNDVSELRRGQPAPALDGAPGRHRWPPRQGLPGEAAAEPDKWHGIVAAIGDLQQAIAAMSPAVLQTATYLLNAQGQAAEQFRVPYRALSVISLSNLPLTVSSAPLQASAPGPGAGAAVIPARGSATVNLSGNVLSVYGGSPGDVVTVTAYSRPMPPAAAAASLPALGAAAAQLGYGTAAAPAAGATVASIAAGLLVTGARYQVDLYAYYTGTPASPADDDNMGLNFNGARILRATLDGAILGPQAPAKWSVLTGPFAGAAAITVTAIGAATAGSVYHAQVVATPVAL